MLAPVHVNWCSLHHLGDGCALNEVGARRQRLLGKHAAAAAGHGLVNERNGGPRTETSGLRAHSLSAARRAGDVLMGDIDRIGASLLNFSAERIPRDRHERAKFGARVPRVSKAAHRDSLLLLMYDEERAQIFTSENIECGNMTD